MTRRFLLLQNRTEADALASEYSSFLRASGLRSQELDAIHMPIQKVDPVTISNYSGVFIGGSPYNVTTNWHLKTSVQKQVEDNLVAIIYFAERHNIPIFGVCYGMGVAVNAYGGKMGLRFSEKLGATEINVINSSQSYGLFKPRIRSISVITGHNESVIRLPKRFDVLAGSKDCPIQAVRTGSVHFFTQFHPELDHEGLVSKIRDYAGYGYFEEGEEADILIKAEDENYKESMQVLKSFVEMAQSHSSVSTCN